MICIWWMDCAYFCGYHDVQFLCWNVLILLFWSIDCSVRYYQIFFLFRAPLLNFLLHLPRNFFLRFNRYKFYLFLTECRSFFLYIKKSLVSYCNTSFYRWPPCSTFLTFRTRHWIYWRNKDLLNLYTRKEHSSKVAGMHLFFGEIVDWGEPLFLNTVKLIILHYRLKMTVELWAAVV